MEIASKLCGLLTVVEGVGDFSASVFNVPNGRHSLSHVNEDVYFQALMYGRADRESYGLPLGKSKRTGMLDILKRVLRTLNMCLYVSAIYQWHCDLEWGTI